MVAYPTRDHGMAVTAQLPRLFTLGPNPLVEAMNLGDFFVFGNPRG